MAKGKGDIKGWITKNGVHIPIYGSYTVREGHEPAVKGSRFKGGKVTSKTVSKALKKEYDEDSKETWYEGKINGKDVRITQETAGSDKFWNVDIGKPGDRHKLLTDNNEPMSFKSLEDAHDEIAHELNSGDKPTNASKGKRAEEEKQARQSFRDKKAQEQGFADYASMRSYEEETGVNRETWQKKESNDNTIEVNGRQIRVRPGENNSQAIYRTAMEEQGKEVDREFYNSQRVDYEETGANKESWQEKKENTLANRNALKQQIDDYTRSHPNPTDEDRHKVSEMRNQYNQMMSEEKGRLKSINNEIKSNSKREAELDALKQEHYKLSKAMDNDSLLAPGSDRKLAELERKISERESSKASNGAPRLKTKENYRVVKQADKTSNSKLTAEERQYQKDNAEVSRADSYNDQVLADFKNSGRDIKHISSTDYAGTITDFKVAAKRAGIDAEYDPGSDSFTLRASKPASKSSTKTPKLVQPTEAQMKELGIDPKTYGKHNLDAAKEAQARYKTSANYAKQKDLRYAQEAQKEKAKAQSIADAISGATGIANSGSIQNMSPSGLKSAYAEATGARKTKIGSELRKRGYQFVGGKWTKKKS